jgi:serine/threonine protein kinase
VAWKNIALKQTQPNDLDLRDGRVILTYDDLERYCQEVKILIQLRGGSPQTSNVLYLYEYFMAGRDIFLITELLDQSLEKWRKDCDIIFTERMAIDICRYVLRSLVFLNERNVVHRDIKLQNIMFRSAGDFRSLKLVDFGLSRVLEENESLRDFCGSVGYISPEVYGNQRYRYEVDMFAFGVLLFRLLSGERPFPNANSQILRRHTMEYRYTVIGNAWVNVSETAKELVRKLLINRQERLTAEQALEHPWFSTPGFSVLRPDFSQLGPEQSNGSEAFLFVSRNIFLWLCFYFLLYLLCPIFVRPGSTTSRSFRAW